MTDYQATIIGSAIERGLANVASALRVELTGGSHRTLAESIEHAAENLSERGLD